MTHNVTPCDHICTCTCTCAVTITHNVTPHDHISALKPLNDP